MSLTGIWHMGQQQITCLMLQRFPWLSHSRFENSWHYFCKFLEKLQVDTSMLTFIVEWQICGDEKASSNDCFKMFNPVDHPTFNVC